MYGRNNPGPTQVVISLEEGGEGTRVIVTHSGIGSGEEWAETVKQFKRGWEVGLENLQSVLETGSCMWIALRRSQARKRAPSLSTWQKTPPSKPT